MRSYSFLFVIGISVFAGYACVPDAAAGYEIFYIGGVRGIYNSAWLGGLAAMLTTMLLWLFGFFMLRSQISGDARLKLGPLIASAPVWKIRYITAKAAANFVVLLVIGAVLLGAFMAMQLLRGESSQLRLTDYMAPFFFVTFPSLFLLASLTVLFDVFPGLKGVVGNVLFFCLWIAVGVVSIAAPSEWWDLFGVSGILNAMAHSAAEHYPSLSSLEASGSFGYYPTQGQIPTFEWQGAAWDSSHVPVRLVWIAAGIGGIVLSALLFRRFEHPEASKVHPHASDRGETPVLPVIAMEHSRSLKLSPAVKVKGARLPRRVKAELKLMLKGMSLWWTLPAIALIAAPLLVTANSVNNLLPFIMIWPLALWSQMGTRDQHYFTTGLTLSCSSPLAKWWTEWLSGVFITLLFSSGAIFRFIAENQMPALLAWGTGLLFIPTLALALGTLGGSKKLFEVIYLLWWYMGPLNHVPSLDFLGVSERNPAHYLVFTVLLFTAGAAVRLWQTGNLSIRRRSI
ncbi:hypothetical protein PGRAT_11795 [Paenibacillus graminis]|uniref:Uncharacterized protein n=2 Tax=Paenibacillus graminis TaxID=189425 RepID=A0A089M361_9BACL|nr:hypothetical protein PGRAT_11795 [Paenibacillus graminis]